MNNFDVCSVNSDGDLESTLQCISNRVEAQMAMRQTNETSAAEELHGWLLILAGALVFFMQVGFAMVCAGAVRKKNVRNAMLKNLLDACGAAVAFYVCGYAFSFGSQGDSTTFLGSSNFFLVGDVDRAFFFFQYAFSATAVTRGFVYPVIVHAVWSQNGYLSSGKTNPVLGIGVIDFAGSGVVHVTGGAAALCASYVVGPRTGRFSDAKGEPLKRVGLQKGQSVALQMLGTMILWFGWYGFNPGSALLLGVPNSAKIAARAAVTTTLSSATGAIVALVTKGLYLKHTRGDFSLDVTAAMNGCLSGLVAITGCCAIVTEGCAIVVGVFAAWIYLCSSALLIQMKVDDAVDAIPVHLSNGIWGLLSVGLFADPTLVAGAFNIEGRPGWLYNLGKPHLLCSQFLGVFFILSWTSMMMIPFFKCMDYFKLLRVSLIDEIVGLDADYNGSEVPKKLFDHRDSENDEELRLKAYQMRFEGKRENKKVSIEAILGASWGDFGDLEHEGGRDDNPNPATDRESEKEAQATPVEFFPKKTHDLSGEVTF